jgi:hypothetical protein
MSFFMKNKDIEEALKDARRDEREKCIQEKEKALQEQADKLNSEWYLKLKKTESELQSVNLRMQHMESKKKQLEIEKQKVREISINQRQITSDLKWLAEQRRIEDIEAGQTFTSLATQVEDIDAKITKELS